MLHKQEALGERRERKCANGSIENFFFFFKFQISQQEREKQSRAAKWSHSYANGGRSRGFGFIVEISNNIFCYRTNGISSRENGASHTAAAAVTKLYPLVVSLLYMCVCVLLLYGAVGGIDFITIIHNGNASTNKTHTHTQKKLKASRSTGAQNSWTFFFFFFFFSFDYNTHTRKINKYK
jgi:hypothetical protein